MMNMKTNSRWSSEIKEEYKKLDKDIFVDVVIIGGGLSGVLTAFYLNDSNLSVALIERNIVGSGVTSKMTAKVTYLQDILVKMEDKKINSYLKSQIEGMKLLKKNIDDYKIDCDFYPNKSYLFTNSESNSQKLENLKKHLKESGIKLDDNKFPNPLFSCKDDLSTSNSYEIHPLKYLNEIKKLCNHISIYENTTIIETKKVGELWILKDNQNHLIKAKKVVFATNYPYFLKPLFFPLKVRLERSYMVSGDRNDKTKERYNMINIDSLVHSIRFYKDKMIYLTNSKILSGMKRSDFDDLFSSPLLKTKDYIWSNMDLITNDYLPIVGEVFSNLYILTGYNTWGILSSHVSSYMIAGMILNKPNESFSFKELFHPRRKITIKKFLNSSLNIGVNIHGYLKGMFKRNDLVFYQKDRAIYIDPNGKKYIVKRKCPHMKCNLLFNEVEKTWDCPCHGSRFDIYGNSISGPSKYDIKIEDSKEEK